MFKYVPVLRYRQEERGALNNTKLTTKTLPLLEILMDKPRSDMTGDFQSIHVAQFNKLDIPVIVDIPLYFPLTGQTKPEIQSFLRPIQANPSLRVDRYSLLKSAKKIIPVSTYDPRSPYIKGSIVSEASLLRAQGFSRIAFRIYNSGFIESLADVAKAIKSDDILIFDLDTAPHTNRIFQNHFSSIQNIKNSKNCHTVIIRSAIPSDVTNVSLVDNQPIAQADNSLRDAYVKLGFDSFGDYAGIKKDTIHDGGTVSPGLIFYSWHKNCYVGYRYTVRKLENFKDHIAPTLVKSKFWSNYGSTHHKNCSGCKMILAILNGTESGKSQGKWKRITIMHYLHTMEEFL